uniref:Putative dap-36 protein member n=1 Tax=Ixodes ricinus TaxID=34613 RepID=A0A0K8RML2_IXORI
MRSAILIATFFIVEVVSKDAAVIFDLTKCVTDFVTKMAKEKHREIVSLNLSAAASFPLEGKTPLRIEVRNITYGNKFHSKKSEKRTNYSTYFMNQDYSRPEQRTYRSDILRQLAAIWRINFCLPERICSRNRNRTSESIYRFPRAKVQIRSTMIH